MTALHAPAMFVGRLLMSVIFISSGWGKLMNPGSTAAYMAKVAPYLPAPNLLVWGVIALELLGGLAILIGILTRSSALALTGFCVASAVMFHGNVGDQAQMISFMKNLAMAGGFLFLAANGPGAWAARP